MYGCIHSIDQLSRPRFFEIEMDNQQDNTSYVTTLCHELTHFEQRLRGKWKQQWKKDKVENKWCSKIVSSDTKYMDEPWEIEAHKLEEEYYEKYNLYNYMKYKENMNGR